MAVSKIEITFGVNCAAGDMISVSVFKLSNPDLVIPKPETFQSSPRTGVGQAVLTQLSLLIGEASAISFMQYWEMDYSFNSFTLSRHENVVTITANPSAEPQYDACWMRFTDFVSTNPGVTAVITDCTAQTFDGTLTLSESEINPCVFLKTEINTNELAKVIELNGIEIENDNNENPYLYDIARGVNQRFLVKNEDGQGVYLPPLSESPINIPILEILALYITPTLSGAKIVVDFTTYEGDLPWFISLSLDGENWQTENYFTGQPNGAGTVYVRDNYGCTKTLDFVIDDAGTRDPFLFISKANAVNFVENEVVDGCSVFRNDANSLAHQSLDDVVYCEQILFKTCDKTTIQLKSNYLNVGAKLRSENGTETDLEVFKQTENLNRFQYMDCWYYKYSEGLTGIYFTSGQSYDYLGFPIVDGDFSLNGNLPDFAIIGTLIELDVLGVFEIVDIVYDPAVEKKAIIIEHIHNDAPVLSRVKSTYDLLPFDVYEFTILWSVFGEGVYDIVITNDDTSNGIVQHISENILVNNADSRTLAIRYFNENNRDIFYKFGIQHFIRMPFLEVEGLPLDESEINITDLKSSVVETSVHELDKFYFAEITKNVMRKLVVALSCENVFINGIGYIKNGNIESEKIKGTNLYLVTATMLKTNINYNNNRQNQTGVNNGEIAFNIPQFISNGDSFLKS